MSNYRIHCGEAAESVDYVTEPPSDAYKLSIYYNSMVDRRHMYVIHFKCWPYFSGKYYEPLIVFDRGVCPICDLKVSYTGNPPRDCDFIYIKKNDHTNQYFHLNCFLDQAGEGWINK